MKKLLLVSSMVFILTACSIPVGKKSIEEVKSSIEKIDTQNVGSTRLATTSGAGEACAGTEMMKCSQGLNCVFNYDTADGQGVCAPKIVNEKECEQVYDLVCGLTNDRQKYNYFNECEMERHGATLLNRGKCEIENVAGSCEAQARGFSNCFDTATGYEFDGNSCIKKSCCKL